MQSRENTDEEKALLDNLLSGIYDLDLTGKEQRTAPILIDHGICFALGAKNFDNIPYCVSPDKIRQEVLDTLMTAIECFARKYYPSDFHSSGLIYFHNDIKIFVYTLPISTQNILLSYLLSIHSVHYLAFSHERQKIFSRLIERIQNNSSLSSILLTELLSEEQIQLLINTLAEAMVQYSHAFNITHVLNGGRLDNDILESAKKLAKDKQAPQVEETFSSLLKILESGALAEIDNIFFLFLYKMENINFT